MHASVYRLAVIFCICLIASCGLENGVPDSERASTLTIKSHGVSYQGILNDQGLARFAGIPFAAPPVGNFRWERPQPFVSDTKVVDASQFAPACMQVGTGLAWYHGMMSRIGVDPSLMEGPEYSEDCLYLNVWTDGNLSEPKPVLVFIHGGSNTGGWSYEPNYHGEALASRGIIVVTVAYRLGVFGWLSHPDMAIQNPGLHDLIAALDWVKENISAFGGDPNRVVVSGESAGADNALHLSIAPVMAGKLAGVIHQSAGWSVTSALRPEDGFVLGENLVKHHLGGEGEFEDLKQVPAVALLDSQSELFSEHYFSPISDPETLPISLQEVVADGKLPPLNLIIGSNRNESLMYISEGSKLEDYLEGLFPAESWENIKAALGAEQSELVQMDRLRSALQYTCPSLALATAVRNAGGDSYVYRFDRVREGFEAIGAYHGAELPYVFDTHDPWMPTNAVDLRITESLVDYWVAFMSDGWSADSRSVQIQLPKRRSATSRLAWPAWSQSQQSLLVSDEIFIGPHPDAELCEFLGAIKTASTRH